jgi:predicted DNA binding CopG/RHH family protein
MKMSLVVDSILSDVAAVGELGDGQVAEVAERIAAVLARSLPTRILDVLSEMAGELSRALPQSRIDIHLDGDDVEFASVDDAPTTSDSDADLSARITLRLSEQLKARVEESASHQGLSVNTWVVRTLERGASVATSTHGNGRAGSRLRGYGTS